MADNQAGSCEPCQRKKCKCDRQRPYCGQCSSMTALCVYSEGHKRGLPSGYLGTLEQRLNDTEAALHEAITEIHRLKEGSSPRSSVRSIRLNSGRPSKISKISRLAEWAKYPLQNSEDVERWWSELGEKEDDEVVVLDASLGGNGDHHQESLSPREIGQNNQRTTFDSFETLLRPTPPNSHGSLPAVNDQSDPSMRDVTSLVESSYSSNITMPPESEPRRSKRRMLPYSDQLPTASISQYDISRENSGNRFQNVGVSPRLDQLQHQPQEQQQPVPLLGSNTQASSTASNESLTTSKHLANTMPDMYY